MEAYKYRALSPDGAVVDGVVEAHDEFEAVAKIKETCPIVLRVKPVPVKRKHMDLNEPLWVSDKALSMTASQFSILLRAGLPTVRTVEVISGQSTDRLMKKILHQVAGDVSAGYSLARSLETRSKKIPIAFIETVRAGEESGTLEQSFDRLAKYYEKAHKMKSKVRGAMMYPAFLSILAVVVIGVVISVAFPVVTGVITGAGASLPLPTQILLGLASFFARWWALVLAALAGAATLCCLYGKTERGRQQFALLAMRLPVLGNMNRMQAASQFANTMSTLLAAGLPMSRALSITGKVLDNYAVGLEMEAATAGIEEGKRLGDVLRWNPHLPPLLIEMTAVGEESGALEETLEIIGAYYDSEVEQAAGRALSLLEPGITVVLGLVIGFIMVALYGAMFTMYAHL